MNTILPLKGFRDFLPIEKRKRDYVALKLRDIFERFGFEPIETPTLEYADLLLGKYGSEADKLVYTFEDRGERKIGLRYDQTVPTARVLTNYQNDLPIYFRRYQIQNVFRADKPQRGRYREFTQCDIDIFGSSSTIADAEILACTYFAYKNIGFENIIILINSRKDLTSLFDTIPLFNDQNQSNRQIWKQRINDFFQILDKKDKIGVEKIKEELRANNFDQPVIDIINMLESKNNAERMSSELKAIIDVAISLGVPKQSIQYSPSLVRGLDYYTGMIFEVTIPNITASSIGGGGRYDNLIHDLGGPNVPAVGMAFGFDRTIECANLLQLLPDEISTAKIFVPIFDETKEHNIRLATTLRASKIHTELSTYNNYHSEFKKSLENQLKIADRKRIPFVIIQGPDEVNRNVVQLKNMNSKEKEELSVDALIHKLSSAS